MDVVVLATTQAMSMLSYRALCWFLYARPWCLSHQLFCKLCPLLWNLCWLLFWLVLTPVSHALAVVWA